MTACDDATLKIFDFAAGTEESILAGHHWDAKSVDWHPTKGLLVSGSKDHQVKLWDPRTGRCLTTLHGHKNTISKTSFEPIRGHLLATAARDQTARVFDLRMMRDVCLLKGHEKDISTLTWHPIHPSLLSTGGADGSIFHYLLDEPNNPPGGPTTIPVYDSPDPANAPTQTINPAHKIPHAHDFAVWSLSWHPLGHILASGSNDRITRFWTRPRPGESDCFNDRFHIGETAADAYGTFNKRESRRAIKEEEEQESEDEADALVDQKMPTKPNALPGLPGLTMSTSGLKDGPSLGGVQALLPPALVNLPPGIPPGIPPPNGIAGMDPQSFAAMMAEGKIMIPPPGHGIPPPPPNFDFSMVPPDFLANFPFPGGFPPPPPHLAGNGLVGMAPTGAADQPSITTGSGGGIRKRAPLPSQQESLLREQRKGKYRVAR